MMNDLISRQAADALECKPSCKPMYADVSDLISRQPEITKRTAETEHFVPNSDLISRKAAIDAFWSLDVELRPSTIDAILNTLNGLPSAQPEQIARDIATIIENEHDMRIMLKNAESTQEQRWIPVTERLPEKHGAYLVYDKEEVLMGYYSTFDRDWTGMNGFPLVNVIAWMPLPEPYKAHMEGAEDARRNERSPDAVHRPGSRRFG